MNSQTPTSSEAVLHAVDYWQVIKNRYLVILLTLALVFLTAAVITYILPKKYESTALVEVKRRSPGLTVLGQNMTETMGGGMAGVSSQFLATEFEVIRSRNVLLKVADQLKLSDVWKMDRESVYMVLKGIVEAKDVRGTDLITIKVRHSNPEDARNIADEVAKAYRAYRIELDGDRAERALDELSKETQLQEDRVEERQKLLSAIVRSHGIIPSSGDGAGVFNRSDDEESARSAREMVNKLEQEKIQLESQINTLLKSTSDQLLAYASGLDLPENIIRTLYPQYLEQQRLLATLGAQGLGERHPTVIAQTGVLENMKRQLNEGVVSLRDTLRTKLELAKASLEKAKGLSSDRKGEAVGTAIASQEYLVALNDYKTARQVLETMQIKLQGERLTTKIPGDIVVVHENPVIAQDPVSPNVKLYLTLGAVLGLAFGVGIAFFLEYLDTSVKTLEDVERYLQVPVLAVVPKDVGVLHKQSGMSPDAEAYRILRTNIEFNRKDPEQNAITVVSGGAGEGKSTTLVNLAYICAQGGYATLMIDADLRRPRLHTFFDINNSVGLTNYLTTELMLEDVILQTPVDNLYFMPSGILPADAAGILNSRRMSELIQDVKARFDLVLVDSPPILGVSDASVLASEVDLTMIVVQHRKLPRNMLIRVKQAVENVGGHVLGVVLNNVDVRSDSQYQYYTSYYTYYAPSESQPTAPSVVSAPQASSAGRSSGKGANKGDSELY